MATAYDCKFIETSVAINHNTDELLVSIIYLGRYSKYKTIVLVPRWGC